MPEYGACAARLASRARATRVSRVSFMAQKVERVMGIEPTLAAWEAAVLPLNYTRVARAPTLRGRAARGNARAAVCAGGAPHAGRLLNGKHCATTPRTCGKSPFSFSALKIAP